MFKAFDFSQEEREEFFLFTVIVAGKSADFAKNALFSFLSLECGISPFDKIRKMVEAGTLLDNLKKAKTGNYHKIYNCFKMAVSLQFMNDLKNVSTEQLESIYGVGPKTSRYFILHTIKEAEVAVLDTHILKWLSHLGYVVPKNTPQNLSSYKKIEDIFLKEAQKRERNIADLDLEIWTMYSRSGLPKFHEEEKQSFNRG